MGEEEGISSQGEHFKVRVPDRIANASMLQSGNVNVSYNLINVNVRKCKNNY